MQVNKALRTCSTGMHMQQCLAVVYILPFCYQQTLVGTTVKLSLVHLALSRVLSAITSSLHDTILRDWSVGQHIKLAVCWHPFGQLAMLPSSQGQAWLVCVFHICIKLPWEPLNLQRHSRMVVLMQSPCRAYTCAKVIGTT